MSCLGIVPAFVAQLSVIRPAVFLVSRPGGSSYGSITVFIHDEGTESALCSQSYFCILKSTFYFEIIICTILFIFTRFGSNKELP